MSLSVINVIKGAERLQKPFDKRISELQICENELLQDDKVQLYLFLHQEILKQREKKNNRLTDYYNSIKEKCDHPLYVCVTEGSENAYSYKCICLTCKEVRYFKQYEMDDLFKRHMAIASKIGDDANCQHYYCSICTFKEALDFYIECFYHVQNLSEDIDIYSAELSALEKTFNHFVYPLKEKKTTKVYRKHN